MSAEARVVVPDLEVDRRAEMLRTSQQKRTHVTSLKVLQAMQVDSTHETRELKPLLSKSSVIDITL